MKNIAKIPLSGRKSQRVRSHSENIPGITCKSGRYDLMNMQPASEGLRTHAVLTALPIDSRLTDIRAIYPFDNKLLILNMESGHIGFFVYNGTTYSKCYSTVQTYPYDFDGSTFSNGLVYTEDGSVHIETGNDLPKLLYFPAYQYATVEGNAPGMLQSMPSEVPKLEFATIAGGRMYGTKGQTVYVSGINGCFDWERDSVSATVSNPNHAWCAGITTHTEKQLPVKALKGYKDYVLIFRENAMQKITGNCNPFEVKDLFRVGTTYRSSVRELEGDLYFIGGKNLYCFNGRSLKKISMPAPSVCPGGPACVYEGRYCFYAEKGNSKLIYSYDPLTDSYGVYTAPGKIVEFALCGEKVLALAEVNGNRKLYYFSEERGQTSFSCSIPLLQGEYGDAELKSTCLHFKSFSSSCTLVGKINIHQADGLLYEYPLFSKACGSGYMTIRTRARIPIDTQADLFLTGSGDILIEGYETCFKIKKGIYGRE